MSHNGDIEATVREAQERYASMKEKEMERILALYRFSSPEHARSQGYEIAWVEVRDSSNPKGYFEVRRIIHRGNTISLIAALLAD